MDKVSLAYRVDLSEAECCDTAGCGAEVAFIDVYVLDNGGLLHSFLCAEHKPVSVGSPVSDEPTEDMN